MPDYQALANAIRALSMDAVEKANSGHPGAPMGLADIATVLWHQFLCHNPSNPNWVNRDRFILSNGHGSMLLYSLLHLTGYAVSLDDLKAFRQLHSITPGHPEKNLTPGVETTTGPLGQGLANAVGFAIGQMILSHTFNRPGFPLIDHYTYVFAGDGDLMEGISHEVCSLAGTLGLQKLIVFYDDNGISIDGDVRGWFSDNVPERFLAYHWHVIPNINGHDVHAINAAIHEARAVTDKPVIICCKTQIAHGAPTKMGTAAAHGAPLGRDEIEKARAQLNWSYPPFEIPKFIYDEWDAKEKGQSLEQAWHALWNRYQQEFPELAEEFTRRQHVKWPPHFETAVQQLFSVACHTKGTMATRKSSQLTLNALAPLLPEIIGGSADLTESNLTLWTGATVFSNSNYTGNYIHYGVREFGMSAIINGLAIYGGFIPFGGTFLTFSDYARNAVRMAALMQCHSIFVYTHDSIGLGEDGPTHQPIEHLAMLRMTPHLAVWRPADYAETVAAWAYALSHPVPTCLVFSRQNLSELEHLAEHWSLIQKGGYILWEPSQKIDAIIIATGSEVSLAVESAKQLSQHHHKYVRVVSMPSTTVFLQQQEDYQASVLPPAITQRVAIEAAASAYWYRFVGLSGKVIGVDRFGESAPAKDLWNEFGFTVEHVVNTLLKM